MNCGNNNDNESCRCIAEILTVINVLQQNANCGDSCLETCDRGFLGCNTNSLGCNTRPVMLYTCCGNGTPWSMPTTRDDSVSDDDKPTTSSVFRVEKIDGCCCTFRVLRRETGDANESKTTYEATNSFFTMNLNCVCALRCLPDTFVECI